MRPASVARWVARGGAAVVAADIREF
jgi:hypothetical protein